MSISPTAAPVSPPVSRYFTEGVKVFLETSNIKPLLRLHLYASEIFQTVRGYVPVDKFTALVGTSYNFIDGCSIFGDLKLILDTKSSKDPTKTKFQVWQENRPAKAWGNLSFLAADTLGFAALLGTAGIINFAAIASKISNYTRIPLTTLSFAFSATALTFVVAAYTILLISKSSKDDSRKRSAEYTHVTYLKLAEYLVGAVSAATACAALAVGSSYIVTAAVVTGVTHETLKLARAIYYKSNVNAIKA